MEVSLFIRKPVVHKNLSLQNIVFFPELEDEIKERWQTFAVGPYAETKKQNTVEIVRKFLFLTESLL